MKFTLSNIDWGCEEDNVENYRKIGFTVSDKQSKNYPYNYEIDSPEIEINTIEELVELIKTSGSSIIMTEDHITIYDDYAE